MLTRQCDNLIESASPASRGGLVFPLHCEPTRHGLIRKTFQYQGDTLVFAVSIQGRNMQHTNSVHLQFGGDGN